MNEYTLYFVDEKITHPHEIAFMLTQTVGIHRIDAIRQVRYGYGCVYPRLNPNQLETLQNQLKQLQIESFSIENTPEWMTLRPKLVKQLELSPEGFFARNQWISWTKLGVIHLGFVRVKTMAEDILELPSFQNVKKFADPVARKALTAKVVEEVFRTEKPPPEEEPMKCYLDLLFLDPLQHLRISREDFQFHWLESLRSPSSLMNLKTLLLQILEYSRSNRLTPTIMNFLENPHQPKQCLDSEEHLTLSTRWYFQKFCHFPSAHTLSPQEIEEKKQLHQQLLHQQLTNSKKEKLLPDTSTSQALSVPSSSLPETSFPDPKVEPIGLSEEEDQNPFFYFIATLVTHMACVFVLAGLMMFAEISLAQLGKTLPKGLPQVLRDALERHYYPFFTPLLFYFCSEAFFILHLFPERFRKPYYVTLIVILTVSTLIIGAYALLQIFQA